MYVVKLALINNTPQTHVLLVAFLSFEQNIDDPTIHIS